MLELEMSEEQRKCLIEIAMLKSKLRATDYQAIKFSEGELTDEKFAPIKAQRKEWRAQINALQEELATMVKTGGEDGTV